MFFVQTAKNVVGRILVSDIFSAPKNLVLRTSVGFENPTYAHLYPTFSLVQISKRPSETKVSDGLVLYRCLFRPHLREQNHIADAGRIGEQHHQTVQPDASAAGGRQAVFHGADVVGIVVHGFVVAGVFLRHLRFEAGGLVFGVVQFRIAVGQLATDHE